MLIKTLTSLATDRAQGAVSILRPKAEFEREETVGQMRVGSEISSYSEPFDERFGLAMS